MQRELTTHWDWGPVLSGPRAHYDETRLGVRRVLGWDLSADRWQESGGDVGMQVWSVTGVWCLNVVYLVVLVLHCRHSVLGIPCLGDASSGEKTSSQNRFGDSDTPL